MKKRILCVLLTLIMLVSLVPATAVTASAATNAVSESAILVLKQLEGYQKNCQNGYIGYGAKCPGCLGKVGVHAAVDGCTEIMYEKEADTVLREELKTLDKAVNSFASANGLSLTQNQHDALVLFSFQNGTAWTIGTGALQTAIKSRYTGTKFVDAICKWNYSYSDDARRMVEANMYLNGIYSSATPSRYIGVDFEINGGSMSEDARQYFDVATPCTINLTVTAADNNTSFLGWYTKAEGGERVAVLNSTHAALYAKSRPAPLNLYAVWQAKDADPGENEIEIEYTISKSSLLSTTVYNVPNGSKVTTYINEYQKEVKISLGNELNVVDDYVDADGVFWAQIAADTVKVNDVEVTPVIGWVKVKGGAASGSTDSATMDLNVTVTNSYLNMRSSASAASNKVGSFNQGDVLRIINVENASNGALWGQVATSASDSTPIGWVALMYTNYDEVVASVNSGTSVNNGTVVATATITYTGYVNVRSDAGINNQIVGALSSGQTVDLYETKYVNGIQWGRCSAGWFCLSYANVTRLVDDTTGATGIGFSNYVFSGTLTEWKEDADNFNDEFFFVAPNGEAVKRTTTKDKNGVEKDVPMTSAAVTISNLQDVGGTDWGKTAYGWIEISNVTLDVAKFYVIADTLTVRENAGTEEARIDVLLKGTEFDVTQIDVIGETIWGKVDKVGETAMTYFGWANLSNENVSRNGAPAISVGGTGSTTGSTENATVTMAKVVGTDSLNVRMTNATYGKKLGTLSYGTTAKVLEEKDGWYKLDVDVDNDPTTDSWVSGTYLEIYQGTPNSNTGSTSTGSTGTTSMTGTGIVANTYTGVNIRKGPSTAYALAGKYITGTTVEILEVTTTGASKWGRTEKGWVCMDYIVMLDNFNPNGGSTGSTTTTTSVAIYTGKLTATTNIYKDTATNTDSEPIGEIVSEGLEEGYPVTVHEIIVQTEYEEVGDPDETNEGASTTITKRTTYWARVNDGYIFAPGNCIALDTLDEHVYTLANAVKNIVNTSNPLVGKATFDLAKGEQVTVTKLRIENADVIGYIECDKGEGEIKMSNMTKGFASSVAPETEKEETNTGSTGNTGNTGSTESTGTVIGSTGNTTNGYANANGYKYTGKVINTNSVNVRATASTGANITTTLKNGAALVVYETVISDGMAWGRCDAGWVYLYYVDLTPVANGAVDARVVYNDNTVIYKDMGMTEATGSTYAKMAVVDIYEIVGKMARTEMGWIHTDNLL